MKKEHFGPRTRFHAVVGVGYTSGSWQIRNSWGKTWGTLGYSAVSRGDYSIVAPDVAYIDAEEKKE